MSGKESASAAHRAGIVQIARKLGISPSTVSRALRPETAQMVREDRRRAIQDLADQLHFTPNVGARMLRQGAGLSLTVVVPHDENIFFSEYYGRLLSCILVSAAARDWDVMIKTLRRSPGHSLRESLQHLGLQSSGLVYLGEPLTREDLVELRGLRRPLVLMKSVLPADVPLSELNLPVVGVDNRSGAQAAADFVCQLGHRRVALISGPEASRDAKERREGYLEVLARRGTALPPAMIFSGPFSAETGRKGFEQMWRKQDRPTAFCCANDEIAFGVIDGARAAGVRCPEDIAVVGFDDGPWALACRPALTTVRQPFADLAERAVGLIVESRVDGGGRNPVHREMPAALVIRDSVVALQRKGR